MLYYFSHDIKKEIKINVLIFIRKSNNKSAQGNVKIFLRMLMKRLVKLRGVMVKWRSIWVTKDYYLFILCTGKYSKLLTLANNQNNFNFIFLQINTMQLIFR
jgi:hypothetical protein